MNNQLLVLDQKILEPKDNLLPFALTDVLTEFAGIYQQPILHFWQLDNTFILGMKDSRIKNLDLGLQKILQQNYQPILRNSGGLGVIADAGVLNVSLILPSANDETISIDFGYEEMFTLIQQVYGKESPIEAKEIPDSYCPGKYDLSIQNKKFAGIAQRRIKKGVAVMLYLSVKGNQEARGNLVKEFYTAALQEDFGSEGYPPVHPQSMANLGDLLKEDVTPEQIKEQLTAATEQRYNLQTKQILAADFIAENHYSDKLASRLAGMQERNQGIQKILNQFKGRKPL